MTKRRSRFRRPPAGVFVCILLLSLRATAEPRADAVWLRWRAPPGCPDRREIEPLLERARLTDRLELEGSIRRDNAGYELHLRVTRAGQRFERSLRAQSCDVLADSAIFLVRLAATQLAAAEPALEKQSTARTSAPAGDGISAATVTAAAPVAAGPDITYLSTAAPQITHAAPNAPLAAESGNDKAGTLQLFVGLGTAATDAGLTGLSPQLAADLLFAVDAWSFGLRVGMLLHPPLRIAPNAEISLRSGVAQLLACRTWQLDRMQLGPCAIVSGLHTVASATGLEQGSTSGSSSWLAGGAGFQVYLRLTFLLHVGAELGGFTALSPRPSFEVSNVTVARAGSFAGYARLAALFELW